MASKNPNTERLIDYHVDEQTRIMYLGAPGGGSCEISPESCAKFIKAFICLEHISKQPITIFLNTEGGCSYSAFAIYDIIAASQCHVIIKGIGRVWSSGSLIMQAADERILYPHTTMMIHGGEFTSTGHPKNVRAWTDADAKMGTQMAEAYAKKSKENKKYWARKLSDAKDIILFPEEALNLGLIDKIQSP